MRHLVPISSLVAIATLLELGLHATSARAQSNGGPYRIDSAVISAGGGTLSGGGFQLRGSLGQPAIGVAAMSGYQLNGGFVGVDDRVFHNGFEYQ